MLQQSACSLCTTVREAPKESPNVTCIANASEMVPAMYRWDAGIYDAEVLTMSCKLINTRINLTMLTGVQITLIKAVKKKKNCIQKDIEKIARQKFLSQC